MEMEIKINELPITEENYIQQMKTIAEPVLDKYRVSDYFEGWDGNKIHYEKFIIPDAVASVVILHGFTESTTKFREMIYIFIQMGFNVFIHDQRGHGRSFRYAENPEVVSIVKFKEYVDDFKIYLDKVVKPSSGNLPLYIFAHSMGGAVAIQYLQENHGVFQKAVLTAPMVLCKCMGIPPKLAGAFAGICSVFGKKHDAVVGSKGFNPNRQYTESNNTSKARFEYIHGNKSADREIQTSDASYGWLKEAVKVSKKNLDPKRCKNIDIPVLLCQPEVDGSVYSEKEDEFIKLVPNGKLVKFTECRHEIFGSVDSTMLPYLQTIEAFYKK